MERITFKLGKTIQVARLGKTTNAKISHGTEQIMQTYTFSNAQFEYVKDSVINGTKKSLKKFFSLDSENCFDCPFSYNSGNGKCYTHKFNQYVGFVSMLRSIVKEYGTIDNIPTYSTEIGSKIVELTKNRYTRFGTYGEPTMHPIELVESMVKVSNSYTGYTHQYARNKEFNQWFMASTHNELQAETAINKFGFRSFLAVKDNNVNAVICPASNESKINNVTCSDCGLCSGINGKGTKNVVILEH